MTACPMAWARWLLPVPGGPRKSASSRRAMNVAVARSKTRLRFNFDFNFNKKMNRSLVFDLATATFIARREDALFLGPPGTGKSHLAQAIGQAVIGQGYRVIYREAHVLLEEIAEAALDGKRKEYMELLATVPLLIIDDLGMRKLERFRVKCLHLTAHLFSIQGQKMQCRVWV